MALAVARQLGDRLIELPRHAGELSYEVTSKRLLEAAALLRDSPELRFEMCMDVCGVDYLQYGQTEWETVEATASGFSRAVTRDPAQAAAVGTRRHRVAVLPSSTTCCRYRSISVCGCGSYCPDDEQPIVDSVTGIWSSANWFERETFDLFGILFRDHPDLRRLLTDYGFIGHPFRKDFPLTGNVEVRYDPSKGRVVYQPVSIEPRVLVPKVIRHDNRYDAQLTSAAPDG